MIGFIGINYEFVLKRYYLVMNLSLEKFRFDKYIIEFGLYFFFLGFVIEKDSGFVVGRVFRWIVECLVILNGWC